MFLCYSFIVRHKQLAISPDTKVYTHIEYKYTLIQLNRGNMIIISHATFVNLTNFTEIFLFNFDSNLTETKTSIETLISFVIFIN